MNLEDLLYEIYNDGLYDEVMELAGKLRRRERNLETKELIDMAYQIVKEDKENKKKNRKRRWKRRFLKRRRQWQEELEKQLFEYNNFEQIKKIANLNQLAAIKMEVQRNYPPKNNFLKKIRKLCNEKGIVLGMVLFIPSLLFSQFNLIAAKKISENLAFENISNPSKIALSTFW